MDPTEAYPGDDVVDIIGMDVYAETWDASTSDPDKRFAYFLDQPFGLKWHRDFAREHGKPISYPEWGVGTRPDGHGVGDDPVFMEKHGRLVRGGKAALPELLGRRGCRLQRPHVQRTVPAGRRDVQAPLRSERRLS